MQRWILRQLQTFPWFSRLALAAVLIGLAAILLHVDWFLEFSRAWTSEIVVTSILTVFCLICLSGLVTGRMYSEVKKARALACTDDLTGLMNRREFKRVLANEVSRNHRRGGKLGLLALDLDRFKVINDTYGHDTGDMIIRMFGERIRTSVRFEDVVCRIAGDEFFILIRDAIDEARVAIVGDRILGLMKEPFHCDNRHINASVSIGAVILDGEIKEAEKAMRMADFALLRSKERGRNCMVHFDPQMAARIRGQRVLELRLLDAVAKRKLSLRYHPIFDNTHGRIVAVEALVRWYDEELGEVPPYDFLPVAEELNLMEDIGNFVLERACEELVNVPDIRLAVNVGEHHFMRDDFVDGVDTILARTQFPAYRLEFEIPLVLLENHAKAAQRKFERLRERGIEIALGDFGTGQSNPMYLNAFKLDRIKIDHSLIKRTAGQKQGERIMASMIALASSFSSRVTVEGIERADQLVRLRENAGAELQGFFFSKPLTMNELARKYALDPSHPEYGKEKVHVVQEALDSVRKLSA